MTRKHPNARRATALALFASLFLAANAGAFFIPRSASADVATTTPGRRPMPGDPNTPDEGGRSGSLNSVTEPKSSSWVLVWLTDIVHFTFRAR
jgi:hypothetical protein